MPNTNLPEPREGIRIEEYLYEIAKSGGGGGGSYTLPQAGENTLGGVKAPAKQATDTQEVRIDPQTGKLYTAPSADGSLYLPLAGGAMDANAVVTGSENESGDNRTISVKAGEVATSQSREIQTNNTQTDTATLKPSVLSVVTENALTDDTLETSAAIGNGGLILRHTRQAVSGLLAAVRSAVIGVLPYLSVEYNAGATGEVTKRTTIKSDGITADQYNAPTSTFDYVQKQYVDDAISSAGGGSSGGGGMTELYSGLPSVNINGMGTQNISGYKVLCIHCGIVSDNRAAYVCYVPLNIVESDGIVSFTFIDETTNLAIYTVRGFVNKTSGTVTFYDVKKRLFSSIGTVASASSEVTITHIYGIN